MKKEPSGLAGPNYLHRQFKRLRPEPFEEVRAAEPMTKVNSLQRVRAGRAQA